MLDIFIMILSWLVLIFLNGIGRTNLECIKLHLPLLSYNVKSFDSVVMSYLVNSQQLPLVKSEVPTRSAKSVRETNQKEMKWSIMSRKKSIRWKKSLLLKNRPADVWTTFVPCKWSLSNKTQHKNTSCLL